MVEVISNGNIYSDLSIEMKSTQITAIKKNPLLMKLKNIKQLKLKCFPNKLQLNQDEWNTLWNRRCQGEVG